MQKNANFANEKIPYIYFCEFCYYKTCNKKDFSKHLETKKHKTNSLGIFGDKIPTSQFVCKCGKKYKHQSHFF